LRRPVAVGGGGAIAPDAADSRPPAAADSRPPAARLRAALTDSGRAGLFKLSRAISGSFMQCGLAAAPRSRRRPWGRRPDCNTASAEVAATIRCGANAAGCYRLRRRLAHQHEPVLRATRQVPKNTI